MLTQHETVAEMLVRVLADQGVTTVFGVISIHNMPMLDAIHRQARIRFVPARGEAGAMNMADAYARVSGDLGVCFTSTGTGAGNAAGAQLEAYTAGSRVLHITTTVDQAHADRDKAAIHDVPRQPDMLKAISKAYFRVSEASQALGVTMAAITACFDAPSSPVSLELPVDVQRLSCDYPRLVPRACPNPRPAPSAQIALLAAEILTAKRPMLWLGGGAHGACQEARELVARGFGVVTSTHGRAVVGEDNPASLGAFNMTAQAENLYKKSDLMLVVGSRLRGNETKNYKLALPKPLIQIDADAAQGGRNYGVDMFIHADAKLALRALLDVLPAKLEADPQFHYEIAIARAQGEGDLRAKLGPYQTIADDLQARIHANGYAFVRDVTISNSTFGNRYVQIAAPNLGVHALGGGIGQGLAMTIGASLAHAQSKTIGLCGDGGLMLNLAELGKLVDENCQAVLILMNDEAYGVIENIQDAQYGGRKVYTRFGQTDFALLAQAVGLRHRKITRVEDFAPTLDDALAQNGPTLLEVDMVSIGPFAESFAGPPAGAAGGAR
jgi:acetolactate synthase I/II/III large subunit